MLNEIELGRCNRSVERETALVTVSWPYNIYKGSNYDHTI